MISRLHGILIEKHPPQIVLDVHGVGYEVEVSMQTFCALPPLGENATLYTQLLVREDAHLLFGFGSEAERAAFRQLIKVSGVGAKTALGLLSALGSDELAQAVAAEDVKRLSAAPGIGKKTAERLILELRGKLAGGHSAAAMPPPSAAADDIVHTLLALGYNEREARAATRNLPAGVDVGEGVRLALKNMVQT